MMKLQVIATMLIVRKLQKEDGKKELWRDRIRMCRTGAP
jgi:hypothetical protein